MFFLNKIILIENENYFLYIKDLNYVVFIFKIKINELFYIIVLNL